MVNYYNFYTSKKKKEDIKVSKYHIRINKYLELKLKNNQTHIYVNKKRFLKCKYLLLEIPVNKIGDFDDIQSIDEVAEKLDHTQAWQFTSKYKITPETAFWGHCSNLQAWVENEYNTRLLHKNLAFPLLKKLTEAGDPVAKKVFKEEIAERFASGHPTVQNYLLENSYLDYLNKEELECLLNINEDDQNSDNYLIIGNSLLNKKRYSEAIPYIIKGLKHEPKSLFAVNPIRSFFHYRINQIDLNKLKVDESVIRNIQKKSEEVYKNITLRKKFLSMLLFIIKKTTISKVFHNFLFVLSENISKLEINECKDILKSFKKSLINLYYKRFKNNTSKAKKLTIQEIKDIQIKRRIYYREISSLINDTLGFTELQNFLKTLSETILSFNPKKIENIMKVFINKLYKMRIKENKV
ncbi:MAG: hypothetical protein ACFFAN_05620 [Promethearchaeota archaeon]